MKWCEINAKWVKWAWNQREIKVKSKWNRSEIKAKWNRSEISEISVKPPLSSQPPIQLQLASSVYNIYIYIYIYIYLYVYIYDSQGDPSLMWGCCLVLRKGAVNRQPGSCLEWHDSFFVWLSSKPSTWFAPGKTRRVRFPGRDVTLCVAVQWTINLASAENEP
jgi:hypothetical protein